MGISPQSCSNYESGADFTMEFGSFRFRFSAEDFAERVQQAAVQLGFVPAAGLGERELDDLVSLAAHGAVERPCSALGAHVAEHGEALVGWDDDLVYWLRKLVFRGAWLDQQIKDGWLEPVFEEPDGFSYRSAHNHEPIVVQAPTPDWSAVGYRVRSAE
jgi:hypothetical protein